MLPQESDVAMLSTTRTYVLYCADWALRQCMFYILYLFRDRHMHQNMWLYMHIPLPSRSPCSSTCFCAPSLHSAFQSVWFTVLSMNKQAKANSPGESSQMHTESSLQCHTHSLASQCCTKLKLSSFPWFTAAHGRQLLIWKCYGNKT